MITKNCLSCNQAFEITDDDLAFYEKVSPVFNGKKELISPPTLCPDCRTKMRTVHRNEAKMYNNVSAVTGKPLVALYAPEMAGGRKAKVYTRDEWWSEDWDGRSVGREFDFSRPFFEQFLELKLQVPVANLVQVTNENCEYTTGTAYCKNCYLINSSDNDEDCYYGKLIQRSRNVVDSSYVYDSEIVYQGFDLKKCYNAIYLTSSQNCTDCFFSDNLSGCNNCFLCTNLSRKEYYFMNQPMEKEEYKKKVSEILGSHANFQKALSLLADLRLKKIHKYANVVNCENSSGDFLINDKNCTNCFDTTDSEDCRYVQVGVEVKDVRDCSNVYMKPELLYQFIGTTGVYACAFDVYVFHGNNIYYSDQCWHSANLFGCVGLRKNEYCILNKQYTKEEYNKLVPKIIEHMRKTSLTLPSPFQGEEGSATSLAHAVGEGGRRPGEGVCEWGEFFPPESSWFGYNETLANEYFPMTREQALQQGFLWNDYVSPPPVVEKTVKASQLPDRIEQIPDEILNWAIECEVSGKPFKIVKQELKFYREHTIPLPHRHPDVRHLDRLKLRNPEKLYQRNCMKCGRGVQTTYSPEKPEIIYCEECYLKEVY